MLIIYDNTALRTSLRTFDGQKAARLYIHSYGINVEYQCNSGIGLQVGEAECVSSLPNSRQDTMNNENFHFRGEFLQHANIGHMLRP